MPRPVDRELVGRIEPLIRERIKLLSEVVEYSDFFFIDELRYTRDELLGKAFGGKPEEARVALEAATTAAGAIPEWTHDALEASLRAAAADLGVKAGDLFALVRVAVTGRRVTPPLFESMEIVGRDRSLERLRTAAAKL